MKTQKYLSLSVLSIFISIKCSAILLDPGSIHNQDGWHVSHTNFDQEVVSGISDVGVVAGALPGALRVSSQNGGNIPGGPMSPAFNTRVGIQPGMNDRFQATLSFRPASETPENSSFDVGFATRDDDVLGNNDRLSHTGVGVNDRLSVLRIANFDSEGESGIRFSVFSPNGEGSFSSGVALTLPSPSANEWWNLELNFVVSDGTERWTATVFAGDVRHELAIELDSIVTSEFRSFNDWTAGRPSSEGTRDYAGANALLIRAGPSDGAVNGFLIDNLSLSTFSGENPQELYATDFSVIPEPSKTALIFGLGAIWIFLRNRRNRIA